MNVWRTVNPPNRGSNVAEVIVSRITQCGSVELEGKPCGEPGRVIPALSCPASELWLTYVFSRVPVWRVVSTVEHRDIVGYTTRYCGGGGRLSAGVPGQLLSAADIDEGHVLSVLSALGARIYWKLFKALKIM